MKLQFLGASETVTGSKTILKIQNVNILIDCGLYQGSPALEKKNFTFPGPAPASIDAVFLTHAHLDHCGYLPKLIKDGFHGKIYCTEETKKLVQIILEDSARIQEFELKEHARDEMIYDELDVEKTLSMMSVMNYNELKIFSHYSVEFFEAGHILGAASIVVQAEGKRVCFSGDLGRTNDMIHKHPIVPPHIDYLVLETTYGNRVHDNINPLKELIRSIKHVKSNNGVLLIPAFAVARTQVMVQILWDLFRKNPQLKIPVFIDSPMGVRATRVYQEYASRLKVSRHDFEKALDEVKLIEFGKDQKRLAKQKSPFILISSSGMLSGGKVLKYFDMYAHHEQNVILLTGYQGEGTLGRSLVEGVKEVTMMGHNLQIRAKIHEIYSLSAHADQSDLLAYIKACPALKKIFLNHGDKESSLEFQRLVKNQIQSETIPETIVVKLLNEYEI